MIGGKIDQLYHFASTNYFCAKFNGRNLRRKKFIWIGILSCLGGVLSVISQRGKYESEAQLRKNIAYDYDSLRERAKFYREMQLPYITNYDEGLKFAEQLNTERLSINKKAPPLFDANSWKKVQKGIEDGSNEGSCRLYTSSKITGIIHDELYK